MSEAPSHPLNNDVHAAPSPSSHSAPPSPLDHPQSNTARQHHFTPSSLCHVIDSNGLHRPATILSVRHIPPPQPASATKRGVVAPLHDPPPPTTLYYVHVHGQDKRLDAWVDAADVRPPSATDNATPSSIAIATSSAAGAAASTAATPVSAAKGKRKRVKLDDADAFSDGIRSPTVRSRVSSPSTAAGAEASLHATASTNGRAQRQRSASDAATAVRNIDKVYYGAYEIRTWYFSPYPLEDDHPADDHHAASPRTAAGGSNSASSALNRKTTAAAAAAAMAAGKSNGIGRIKREKSSLGRDTPPRDHTASPLHQPAHHHLHRGPGGALGGSVKDAPAVAAVLDASPSEATTTRKSHHAATAGTNGARSASAPGGRNLWICEGCFKYMKSYSGYAFHKKQCTYSHPPGRKVYERGGHIIWEVDGADAKLYAQNLSLFGKLFIDHKTLYFDVEPFLFYVLTEAQSSSFDHAVGFFSKEKQSYDDYNLACIITFPPFQRKSFGTLMIEFSYALSARQGMLGTPERPLSDLGLKGYVSFWSAVVVRTLLIAFGNGGGGAGGEGTGGVDEDEGDGEGRQRWAKMDERSRACAKLKTLETRCSLLGLPREAIEQDGLDEVREACRSKVDKDERRAARVVAASPSAPASATDAVGAGGERKGLTIRLRRKIKTDDAAEAQPDEPPTTRRTTRRRTSIKVSDSESEDGSASDEDGDSEEDEYSDEDSDDDEEEEDEDGQGAGEDDDLYVDNGQTSRAHGRPTRSSDRKPAAASAAHMARPTTATATAAGGRTLRERRTRRSEGASASTMHGTPQPLTVSTTTNATSASSTSSGAGPRAKRYPAHPALLLSTLDDFPSSSSTSTSTATATTTMTVETTLDLLSKTTHLRTEDIAVALAECVSSSSRTTVGGLACPFDGDRGVSETQRPA
ncbi:uncharacterized protein PSFLO_03774 [Pseudozyma flocculosa]|uniref:histone acetyltransferase n=1 Tax=Pseudozyma flocculosa TaxID=84751 RepID=A0A5C3F3P1_9BASI|nr:uncharacterized protein PSFLO_03774 [Pseudozyma flocculosa]